MVLLYIFHGNAGILEPTIRVGAPCIVEIEKLTPFGGNSFVENCIFAFENASRKVLASGLELSGILIPNTMALDGLTAPGAVCQLDFARSCEICIARNKASGSPSIYRRFTEPGLEAKTFSNINALSCGSVRHATDSFNRSVSRRALAASFSNSAARAFAPADDAFASSLRADALAAAALASSALEFAPAKLASACFAAASDCAAAALAFAIDAFDSSDCFSRDAVRSRETAMSRFKFSSFTLPIQTTKTFETTPIVNPIIKPIFDRSYNQTAVLSEGHIRISPWLALFAIIVTVISGSIAIYFIVKKIIRRR